MYAAPVHGRFLPLLHGVATRRDVAPAPLDLGRGTGAGWGPLLARLGAGWEVAVLRQVHGARVIEVERGRGPARPLADADGMVTARAGVLLAIRVADCVPVLLAAPGPAVGALHAGWRGVAAGVVAEGVARLVALAGAAPGELEAWVGPHVGPCCYAVGQEVVEAVAARTPGPRAWVRRHRGRPRVDLGAAVEAQLRAAGLERVERADACTACDPDLPSHRRDGPAAGRTVAVVGIPRPGEGR